MLPNIQAYRIRVAIHLVVTGIHNNNDQGSITCIIGVMTKTGITTGLRVSNRIV